MSLSTQPRDVSTANRGRLCSRISNNSVKLLFPLQSSGAPSSKESEPRGVQAPYSPCSHCFPSCAIVSAHLGTSREALSLCQVLRAGVLDQGRDRSAASSRCLSSCSSTCPGHARAAPASGNLSLPWGYPQLKETQMLQPHPRQPRAVPSITGR